MPKLSIIVPIYNVEKYLSRCIESILGQTYTDFEAILVDDGSPDECGKVIDEYAKIDSRIIVIHQDNKGVSAARNAGLRIAKGEYIGFVDPDDWIDKNMYERLIKQIELTGSDFAYCSWDVYYEDERSNEKHLIPELDQTLSSEQVLCHLFDSPRTISGAVWNKLIKKSMIHYGFDESYSIGEDWLFITQLCSMPFLATGSNEALYHYYSHSQSVTNADIGQLSRGVNAERTIIGLASKISKTCGFLAEKDYLDSCLRYYIVLKANKCDPNYKSIRTDFYEYMKNNYLSIMSNRHIKWKLRINYTRLMISIHFELKREKG